MDIQNFKVDTTQSNIRWTGRKITGEHYGNIGIKEGQLTFENGFLKSGKVVVNTQDISILDISDKETNAQFAGHLASDDFFNSEAFPEAVFSIVSAEPASSGSYHVEGTLTIKGITHPIAVKLEVEVSEYQITIKTLLAVDRTKYNMKFRSGNFFSDLGDTLIYNIFDLNIQLQATAGH